MITDIFRVSSQYLGLGYTIGYGVAADLKMGRQCFPLEPLQIEHTALHRQYAESLQFQLALGNEDTRFHQGATTLLSDQHQGKSQEERD